MFNQTHILLISYTQNNEIILNGLLEFIMFFNQARAGLWLARAWFLIIASVCEFLYACVCVSAPKAINNWWHDMV